MEMKSKEEAVQVRTACLILKDSLKYTRQALHQVEQGSCWYRYLRERETDLEGKIKTLEEQLAVWDID